MKKENFKHNHKNRRPAGDTGTKTCFMTKETEARENLLRFVSSPDRMVVFDVAEKLPGRGMWIKASKSLLEQAVTKRIFYKAAHGTVKIPEDLTSQVETGLKARCLSLISLCRKAGLLLFGYEAVKKAVGQGEAVAAFEAQDSSERGQNKLFKPTDTFPIYNLLTREELGQIVSQAEVVHIALLNGKLSDEACIAAHKLALYQGVEPSFSQPKEIKKTERIEPWQKKKRH